MDATPISFYVTSLKPLMHFSIMNPSCPNWWLTEAPSPHIFYFIIGFSWRERNIRGMGGVVYYKTWTLIDVLNRWVALMHSGASLCSLIVTKEVHTEIKYDQKYSLQCAQLSVSRLVIQPRLIHHSYLFITYLTIFWYQNIISKLLFKLFLKIFYFLFFQ